MKGVKARLAVHFTYQFFFFWIAVVVFLIVSTMLLFRFHTNYELKKSFPVGVLDSIISDTVVMENNVSFPASWSNLLQEKGYWLQIVNEDGKVIFATHGNEHLPVSYTATELSMMERTGQLATYRVMTQLDSGLSGKLFYILGCLDTGTDRLQVWVQTYNENGLIKKGAQAELERLLEPGEYVQILNAEGKIVQTTGSLSNRDDRESYRPLDLVSMRWEPGLVPAQISFYHDPASKHVWLLHSPKQGEDTIAQPYLDGPMFVLIITGLIGLLLALLFAVWHGYRYGKPLLLFADWFERMGQGHYDKVLTEKDHKRIFRKDGAIRRRYQLYKEVIAGFYDMAEKLASAERERKRLEETREEWMTGISHDLRTPLSTIQGYGHLLESGQFSWTDDELQEMGHMIREKGEYMLELLQDFSITFQLKNNAAKFPIEDIELNEFVRRVVLKYINDATIQHVTLLYEGEEIDMIVQANRKWFQRMLDNLIMNAVKHNPAGTEIRIKTLSQMNEAIIMIEDNGIGMDDETKRNLFERYYRGTNTEEGTDGAGLGMSIANAIVKAYQGKIDVVSAEGVGTQITLRFPIKSQGS